MNYSRDRNLFIIEYQISPTLALFQRWAIRNPSPLLSLSTTSCGGLRRLVISHLYPSLTSLHPYCPLPLSHSLDLIISHPSYPFPRRSLFITLSPCLPLYPITSHPLKSVSLLRRHQLAICVCFHCYMVFGLGILASSIINL